MPASSHPPPTSGDPYRSGSRGSSRSSSPLTPFPHPHHQQASYGVEVRGSPTPLDNPLPLPPKPRAMPSDACRTLPHLPNRTQQLSSMASLNRQCLRSGEQYSYGGSHYSSQHFQPQWRASPISIAEGVAPDVNLNPWPHPSDEEGREVDLSARFSHGIPLQHWRYNQPQQQQQQQQQHHGQHSVFPVVLERSGGALDQLGFRIEGGMGTPHNRTNPEDQSFYVTQVLDKSPASATLQPGDRILQVNGVDLCGLDHMQALDTIRSAGPSLSLLISRER